MITASLVLVLAATILAAPGPSVRPALAFQYSNNLWTGTTSRSNATQSGLVVTITPTGQTTAITPVSSTLGLPGYTASNYAPPVPSNAATAIFRTVALGCAPSPIPCAGRGTITVSFEHPTRNPVLYFAGLGGYQQIGTDQSQLQTQLTMTTAGLTLSQTAGSNLTVSGNVVRPSSPLAGVSCTTTAQGTAAPAGALGGCGSVRVNGLVTSVSFSVAILNTTQTGTGVIPTGTNGDDFGVTVSFDEDFSDGPVSYDGGIAAPRSVLTDVVLGSGITADNLLVANGSVSPNNSATATGDSDDAFSAPFPPLRPGVTTTYTLNVPYSGASKSGTLCGWIDFNRNGVFLSTGVGAERACGTFVAGSGAVALTWTAITGLVAGDSFARFRIGYTSSQVQNALSNGDSGEIEDYLVPITNAAIVLTKSATVDDPDGDGVVEVGETITYSFSVRNTGTVPVDVAVTDPRLGGSVPCGTGPLAGGATRACPAATYTIAQADIGTTITNVATATGHPATGSDVVATASAATELPIVARVALDKVAGAVTDVDGNGVDAGDTITYSFTVSNVGNVGVDALSLDDALVGLAGSPCGTGLLAVGESRACDDAVYTIVQGDVGGSVANVAAVTATPVTGGDAVTAEDETSTPVEALPAVALDKVAGAVTDVDGNGVDAGDTITYSFTVSNVGNVGVDALSLDDALVGLAGSPCGTGLLAVGESRACDDAVYTIVQGDVGGSVANVAAVTATPVTGGDAVTAEDETSTPVEALPAVALDKVAGAVTDVDGNGVDAGDTITYSFTVSNVGNVGVDALSLDDALVGLAGSPCGTGLLAVGESRACDDAVYTIVQGDVGGSVANVAAVTATPVTGGDAVTAEDETSTPVEALPAVALDKVAGAVTDVDGNGVDAGDTITYSFTVSNVGNVGVDALSLDDALVGLAGSPCGTGLLAVGESRACDDAVYTIVQGDVGGSVANVAAVTATPVTGGDAVTAEDETSTPVEALPAVALDKVAGAVTDVDGNGVDAGDTITYSFTVSNVGNVGVDALSLDDALVGLAGSPCGTGLLAVGESRACDDAVYTLTTADLGSEVTNNAIVTATAPNGDPATASDGTTTPVPAAPSVALDKQSSGVTDVDGNGVDSGDTITYGFVVTNTGNVPLEGITIDDPFLDVTAAPCLSGPLAPGATRVCPSVTYVLTESDLGASIENTATVSASTAAGPVVSASDVLVTAVPPACSIPPATSSTTTEAPDASAPTTEPPTDLSPDGSDSPTTELAADSSPDSSGPSSADSSPDSSGPSSADSSPDGTDSPTTQPAVSSTMSSSAPIIVGSTTIAAGNELAPSAFARPTGGAFVEAVDPCGVPTTTSTTTTTIPVPTNPSVPPTTATTFPPPTTAFPSTVAPTSTLGLGGGGGSGVGPATLPASGSATAAPLALAAIVMSLLGGGLLLSARARRRESGVDTRSSR